MWRGLGVVSQPYLFVWWPVTLKIWDVLLPSSHQWQKLCFKTSKENLRSHKVRLRRNKQQLFASVTTLLACFHCAVHWTWQLACKPVSVWFGCSADKLDCVVLSVGALLVCSVLVRRDCFTSWWFSVLHDFKFKLFCMYYHTTDLIILLALIWRILSFRF